MPLKNTRCFKKHFFLFFTCSKQVGRGWRQQINVYLNAEGHFHAIGFHVLCSLSCRRNARLSVSRYYKTRRKQKNIIPCPTYRDIAATFGWAAIRVVVLWKVNDRCGADTAWLMFTWCVGRPRAESTVARRRGRRIRTCSNARHRGQ